MTSTTAYVTGNAVAQALTSALPHRGLLIDGHWRPADNGATFNVANPYDESPIADVADGTDDDIRLAVDAAANAFSNWSSRPAIDRARMLYRAADLLRQRANDVATIMTAEQGKPLSEAKGEVEYAAGFFEWFSGEAERAYGQVVNATRAGHRILVLRQPVGVTAAITPWNFPAAMLTRKLGPALAAGCTSVCKPASATPLTALAIGQVLTDAGVPDGVVNVVTTRRARRAADVLMSDERVRKVSFTGSTEVGQYLIGASAATVKRLSLELGGHAPFVIFDDADPDRAVAALMTAKFRNAGQTCISVNRVYVHTAIAEEVASRLSNAMRGLVMGNGLAPGTQIGPLIDNVAVAKVAEHVDDAVRQGARLHIGGRAAAECGPRFFEPTIVTDVTPAMLVSREETFGPLVAMTTFTDDDEAIAMANDTPFGLAAYFCTRDYARLLRTAERLDYGIIGANDGAPSSPSAPFGGRKLSGYGREGGAYGIDEYLDVKYISIGGITD